MAVGPNDLLALTPEDEAGVGKLEKLIDEKLQANYEPGGNFTVNLAPLADSVKHRLTFKMKRELCSRYEKVGWAVKLDGSGVNDFIIFEGPVGPPPKADIVPQIDVDQMLNRMAEKQGEASSVRPPVIKQATRDDPELPYNRSKLASRP